jgi:hypothetical protein
MPDDDFHTHLGRALADADQTVIVASVDATGLVCQTRTVRTRDLVAAARSLLSQASDLLDDAGDEATGEEMDEDDAELLDQVTAALAELPDDDA